MALEGWTAEKYTTSWVAAGDGYLPYPWSTNIRRELNVTIKKLVGGKRGRQVADTTSWTIIDFTFGNMDNTEFGVWDAFMLSQEVLRLTDLNSNTYIGTFTKFDREEISIDGEIKYGIVAVFTQAEDPS